MDGGDIAIFISKYSLVIAIVIIILFFVYHIFIKPKVLKDNNPSQSAVNVTTQNQVKEEGEKETAVDRMSRGFKVLQEKIRNSDYVKNMEAEKQNSSFSDFLPPEIFSEEKDSKNRKDPFATDFSNIGGGL